MPKFVKQHHSSAQFTFGWLYTFLKNREWTKHNHTVHSLISIEKVKQSFIVDWKTSQILQHMKPKWTPSYKKKKGDMLVSLL